MTEEDFKNPFSQAFRDNLREMSETIQQMEERFSQIEKSAADVPMFDAQGEGGTGRTCFILIGGGGGDAVSEQCTIGGSDPSLSGISYNGTIFQAADVSGSELEGAKFKTVNLGPGKGWDIYQEPNIPDEYPSVADILLPPDKLDNGTVAFGQLIYLAGNIPVCVFSSVLPRLSVICLEDEEPKVPLSAPIPRSDQAYTK